MNIRSDFRITLDNHWVRKVGINFSDLTPKLK